ncbi:unnamed protein product, partial [Discosporangium mesarthrocarpum]
RRIPSPDSEGPTQLPVNGTRVDGIWTEISFVRGMAGNDPTDYNLFADFIHEKDTSFIFAWRSGQGLGQHPNSQRLAAQVNLAQGEGSILCEEEGELYFAVHGTLLLVAWMILVPIGLYFARYRKGTQVAGGHWYEAHAEAMIIAAEAVVPLAGAAIFVVGKGAHGSDHAKWGFYILSAVALQLLTGWLRVRALSAKESNWSLFHRVNKYVHVWSGRFVILAGIIQCYRGLNLVSPEDNLVFEAIDIGFEFGSFGFVERYTFPIWFSFLSLCFLYLETAKQLSKFRRKGKTVCGCVDPDFQQGVDGLGTSMDRLMPRTEEVPIYTTAEFNDKVLNGRRWMIVDAAVVDVSYFAQRHPGGARLILNAVGTDVTSEILGEMNSIGHTGMFPPNKHSEEAIGILKTLVVGYMEEETDREGVTDGLAKDSSPSMLPDGLDSSSLNKASRLNAVTAIYHNLAGERNGKTSKAEENDVTGPLKNAEGSVTVLSKFPVIINQPCPPDMRGGHVSIGTSCWANVLMQAINSPAFSYPQQGEINPRIRVPSTIKTGSERRMLDLFHVCPLLTRFRLDRSKRPVYSYIFRCPGQAQSLVQAITGICYFNMRITRASGQVVQRSYNAYAVRVQFGKKGEVVSVLPAAETEEGELCVEMRIRLYSDGSMSNLLEIMANDAHKTTVAQLQGPFMIMKLIPPPLHRRVVLVAAGTGINPSGFSALGDYAEGNSSVEHEGNSTISLLWQNRSELELYCVDELEHLQLQSRGKLGVTLLLSGDSSRRNKPKFAGQGTAAQREGKRGLRGPPIPPYPLSQNVSSLTNFLVQNMSGFSRQRSPINSFIPDNSNPSSSVTDSDVEGPR